MSVTHHLGIVVLLLVTRSSAASDVVIPDSLELTALDAARERQLPLRVYLPSEGRPQPLILFSHGLGGSRDCSVYLADCWSEGGFVCVFMQHPGSDRDVWQSVPLGQRRKSLKDAASIQSALDRFADVPSVLDQLQQWNQTTGHPLYGRMDLEQVGLAGHSFGAITTLALAGRRFPFGRQFSDERIDAFVAMSPSSGRPMRAEREFAGLQKPVMCMTGTLDNSPLDASTTPESRRAVFDALPDGNKYQLVLDGGTHFAFSDVGDRERDPNHHAVIAQLSLAFFRAYLLDDVSSRDWLQSNQVRENLPLKTGDVWEWK